MTDPDHQVSSTDNESDEVSTQKRENGRVSSTPEKTAMSTASPTSSDESIDFSTTGAARFVTANELRDIHADPFLSERDVWGGPTGQLEHTCTSCRQTTADPSRTCPDCALEERGRSR